MSNFHCDASNLKPFVFAFFQVSLMGLAALLALLHHSHFYREMSILLANYYPQPAIHPVSVAGGSPQSSPAMSQATMTTSGTTLSFF